MGPSSLQRKGAWAGVFGGGRSERVFGGGKSELTGRRTERVGRWLGRPLLPLHLHHPSHMSIFGPLRDLETGRCDRDLVRPKFS